MTNESKVWLITSASGVGRASAEAALERGDRVIATARDPWTLDDLAEKYPRRFLALALDAHDAKDVVRVVIQAREHFGRLDVVVTDASSAEDPVGPKPHGDRAVLDAVVAILKRQRAGHLVQVSSSGGLSASDIAGLIELGVRVTIVEPASAVASGGASAREAPEQDECDLRERIAGFLGIEPAVRRARAASRAIARAVVAADPPLHLSLADEAPPSGWLAERGGAWVTVAGVTAAALMLFRT